MIPVSPGVCAPAPAVLAVYFAACTWRPVSSRFSCQELHRALRPCAGVPTAQRRAAPPNMSPNWVFLHAVTCCFSVRDIEHAHGDRAIMYAGPSPRSTSTGAGRWWGRCRAPTAGGCGRWSTPRRASWRRWKVRSRPRCASVSQVLLRSAVSSCDSVTQMLRVFGRVVLLGSMHGFRWTSCTCVEWHTDSARLLNRCRGPRVLAGGGARKGNVRAEGARGAGSIPGRGADAAGVRAQPGGPPRGPQIPPHQGEAAAPIAFVVDITANIVCCLLRRCQCT